LTHYKGRTKWFVNSSKGIEYIPKKEREYAKVMALKRCNAEKIINLESEREALMNYALAVDLKNKADKALNDYGYMDLLFEKKKTITPRGNGNWESQGESMNQKFLDQLRHKTKAGHLVRSKSEVLIDNILFEKGLDYRYEHELVLGDVVLYPDFTIIHPVLNEKYYFEHFGMFDNSSYRNKAYEKLDLYARNGIFPGDRLIVTYESADSPLDSIMVENMFEYIFFT